MPPLSGPQIKTLRDILCRVFKIEELTQLLLFKLDIALADIVAVPRPELSVAFDLIEWLEARNRTVELLRALRDERAGVPEVKAFCDPLLDAPPPNAAVANPVAMDPVQLNDLIVSFRARFEERHAWFGRLNAYKTLHDVLHKLQDQQIAIGQATARFRLPPNDPLELTQIAGKIDDELVAVAKGALPQTEFPEEQEGWVAAFAQAVLDLSGALDPPQLTRLDTAVELLGTLYNQQSALNLELVRCAKRLKTDDLIRQMEAILAGLGGRAASLQDRLVRFRSLCQRLNALIVDHDACQEIEPGLLAVTATAATRELVAEWSETLAVLLRIAARRPNDPQAARLAKFSTGFDTATDPKLANGQFVLLRDQFGRLFNKTDDDLLKVTDGLVREAELLGIELKKV